MTSSPINQPNYLTRLHDNFFDIPDKVVKHAKFAAKTCNLLSVFNFASPEIKKLGEIPGDLVKLAEGFGFAKAASTALDKFRNCEYIGCVGFTALTISGFAKLGSLVESYTKTPLFRGSDKPLFGHLKPLAIIEGVSVIIFSICSIFEAAMKVSKPINNTTQPQASNASGPQKKLIAARIYQISLKFQTIIGESLKIGVVSLALYMGKKDLFGQSGWQKSLGLLSWSHSCFGVAKMHNAFGKKEETNKPRV